MNEARAHIAKFETIFSLMPDTPEVYSEWKTLVNQHAVRGKNAHNARIVAAMVVHGIARLVRFNHSDFKRYEGIITVVELERP